MRKAWLSLLVGVVFGGVIGVVFGVPTMREGGELGMGQVAYAKHEERAGETDRAVTQCGTKNGFFGLKGWYHYLDCETAGGRQTVASTNFTEEKLVGSVWKIILTILTDLFFMVGLLAVGLTVYGGYLMVLSGGDVGAVEKGKKTVVGAVVGLIIALVAHVVVNTILGVFSSGGGFAG